MPFYLIFDSVDVRANGVKLSTPGLLYSYKNAIQDILSFSEQHKKTVLSMIAFSNDTAAEHDSTVTQEGTEKKFANKGYKQRYEWFKDGENVYLMGRIGVEIASCERFIPPNVDLDFLFVKNSPKFYLMGKSEDSTHKLEIEDFYLYARNVRVSDEYMRHFLKSISQKPAYFPFKRSTLLTRTVTQGQKNLVEPNLFFDIIPNKLVIAMVEEEGFSGNIKKNPLKFSSYDLASLELYVNNFSVAFTPLNISKELGTKAYIMTQDATGHLTSQVSNGITPKMFAGGYTIMAFDLRPEATDCLSPTQKGTLQLKMTFDKALPHNIILMVYGETDSAFQITADNRVLAATNE